MLHCICAAVKLVPLGGRSRSPALRRAPCNKKSCPPAGVHGILPSGGHASSPAHERMHCIKVLPSDGRASSPALRRAVLPIGGRIAFLFVLPLCIVAFSVMSAMAHASRPSAASAQLFVACRRLCTCVCANLLSRQFAAILTTCLSLSRSCLTLQISPFLSPGLPLGTSNFGSSTHHHVHRYHRHHALHHTWCRPQACRPHILHLRAYIAS